jgi:hypothetical protein
MTAKAPGEIIHMSFITTNTLIEGKVSILIAVDNYSRYVFGTAVERDVSFQSLCRHIDTILKSIHAKHPRIIPLCFLAYGNELIRELETKYAGRASFLFDPVTADEVAMPAAKDLLKQLSNKDSN